MKSPEPRMVLLRGPEGLLSMRPMAAEEALRRHPSEYARDAIQPDPALSWTLAEENGREALQRAEMRDRGEPHAADALRENERLAAERSADVAAFLDLHAEEFAAFRKSRRQSGRTA